MAAQGIVDGRHKGGLPKLVREVPKKWGMRFSLFEQEEGEGRRRAKRHRLRNGLDQ